ncbi:MAG TPA: ferredoxin family protein [Roseiarcus sp.]|nr:ferredoxin family protein [Roseiarcus sp.]
MSKPGEVRVEEKLYQSRYLAYGGRSHIRVVSRGKPSANLMAMTTLCPAGRCTLTEAGQVEIPPDDAFERGARRVICEPSGEVE